MSGTGGSVNIVTVLLSDKLLSKKSVSQRELTLNKTASMKMDFPVENSNSEAMVLHSCFLIIFR